MPNQGQSGSFQDPEMSWESILSQEHQPTWVMDARIDPTLIPTAGVLR